MPISSLAFWQLWQRDHLVWHLSQHRSLAAILALNPIHLHLAPDSGLNFAIRLGRILIMSGIQQPLLAEASQIQILCWSSMESRLEKQASAE